MIKQSLVILSFFIILIGLVLCTVEYAYAACTEVCGTPGKPCKCKPCDVYDLNCGYTASNSGGAMETLTCKDNKLHCVIKLQESTCKAFGLTSQDGISAGALQQISDSVQDFSKEVNRNNLYNACIAVHEITHAQHRCDDVCNTEPAAYSAESQCLNKGAQAICNSSPTPKPDPENLANNRCSSIKGAKYIPQGKVCASAMMSAEAGEHRVSWFNKRCASAHATPHKTFTCSETFIPFYCYHTVNSSTSSGWGTQVLTGIESAPFCSSMEGLYGQRIDDSVNPPPPLMGCNRTIDSLAWCLLLETSVICR